MEHTMSRPIRNNPATSTGAGGLAISAILVAAKVDPAIVLAWNSFAAIATITVRTIDVNGGLHGLWQRLWDGKPRG